MNDLVSVVIPTYNRASLITRTINSVIAQTYNPIEILVIDDGSTDDTWKKLAEYGDLIKPVRQSNKGRSAARNHGLRLAKGAYIAFLDSDDFWAADFISAQVAALRSRLEASLCYSWWASLDANENVLRVFKPKEEGEVFAQVFWKNFITPSHVLTRRSCFENGLENQCNYDDTISAGEDWKLWMQLSLRHKFCFVPKVLAFITTHEGNTYSTMNMDKIIGDIMSIESSLKNNPDYAVRVKALGKCTDALWPAMRGYMYYRRNMRKMAVYEYLKALRTHPRYWIVYKRMAQLITGPRISDILIRKLNSLHAGERQIEVPKISKRALG